MRIVPPKHNPPPRRPPVKAKPTVTPPAKPKPTATPKPPVTPPAKPRYPGERPRPRQGPVVTPSDALGSVSRKHESKGRPAAIGYDTGGGYSYGLYQVSTKSAKGGSGTMPTFLSYLKTNAPDLHAQLVNAGGAAGARAGSKQYMDAWQNRATSNPQRFADIQQSFIKTTLYEPVAQKVNSIK